MNIIYQRIHTVEANDMVVDNHFRDITKMAVENKLGVGYGR